MNALTPRYQLLPPLSAEEYAALREDIAAAGVRVPIDVDENGEILDGHHRKQIADEIGVECPERIVRDLPEFAKVDYALSVNLARRHLDREGRRSLVVKSLKRDPRLSDREHARRCGVSHPYVAGIREAMHAAGQLEAVTSRLGRDGRERELPAQDHRVPAQPGVPEPDPVLAGPAPEAEAGGTSPPVSAPQERIEEGGAPWDPTDAPVDHRDRAPGEADELLPSAVDVGVQPPASADPEPDLPPPGSGSQIRTEGKAGPPCEKCGAPIDRNHWAEGLMRCADCDPRGLHVAGDDGCGICTQGACPTCGQPLPT